MVWDIHKTESDFCNLVRLVCIKLECCDTKYSLEQIPDLFNVEIDKAKWEVAYMSSEDAYEEADSLLADFFMPTDKEECFKSLLSRASDNRKLLVSAFGQGKFFFSPAMLSSYLDSYYDLVSYIYLNHNYLKSNKVSYNALLDMILNVDIVFNGDEGSTFFAPMVLDGINHLYRTLYNYQNKIQGVKNPMKLCNYREVIISKILRLFRWKLVHNGEIMQAALPAYVRKKQGKALKIPVKNFDLYNSYEGIGELRLLDKLLYEIDRIIEDKEDKKIDLRVALFGDVNEVPMREFLNILDNNLRNDEKYRGSIYAIKFDIYTKNTYDEGFDFCISKETTTNILTYKVIPYTGQLKIREKIEEIISDNNLIFILDSCDIYNPYEVKIPKGTDVVGYLSRFDKYSDYLRRTCYGDLKKEDNFHDLTRQLYSCYRSGGFGYLKKELNFGLINYIKQIYNKYNNQENRKTIYIYASDAEAFDSMFFDEEWFARVERYHEKQIAIMRISGRKEEVLELGKTDELPIIVFTLWQFIKHMAIRNIDDIKNFFGLGDEDVYLFKEIKIGIDYRRWPESLYFYFDLPEKIYNNDEARLKFIEYLEQVVMPIFGQHDTDMYFDYFVKASSSFLYSDVKNVSDMLFLHLFVNKHSLLGETRCIGSYPDLEKHRPKNCKYSQKRYYEYIMRDYDTSSENFHRKYEKLELLSQGGPDLRDEIFCNIKIACERNSYTHSYLYERCIEMCS